MRERNINVFLFLKTELIMCPGLLGSQHTRTGLSLSQHADCLTQPSACAKRARNTSQLFRDEKRNQEDAESLGVVWVWLDTSLWQSHVAAPPPNERHRELAASPAAN